MQLKTSKSTIWQGLSLNTIYNMDCIEGMKLIPDCSIDLTVTSPPYDNLRTYDNDIDKTRWEHIWKPIIQELYRVTKEWWVVVWVVWDATIKWSETGTSFKQALYFKEIGFNLHDTMIYEKSGFPFPMQNRYYQSFEYMFVFSKGTPKTVNLLSDRKNIYAGGKVARNKGIRSKNGEVVENSANRLDKNRVIKDFGVRFNIWRITNSSSTWESKKYKHPAMFPEKLAEDHIITWSNEWDIVLDPFMWSFTTAVAVDNTNRKWIWIEMSEEYCKIWKERIIKNRIEKWLDLLDINIIKINEL